MNELDNKIMGTILKIIAFSYLWIITEPLEFVVFGTIYVISTLIEEENKNGSNTPEEDEQ